MRGNALRCGQSTAGWTRAGCVKVVVIFVGEDTSGKDGEARQCLGIVDAASQTQLQPEDGDKIYEKCSMELTTGDFDYDLPGELIAQQPCRPRDRSRLMVLRRSDGAASHHIFSELPELLQPGDLLVVNDTRVIPAKFTCRRQTGGRIEGLFLRQIEPGRWEVLLKGAGRCRLDEKLQLVGASGSELRLAEKSPAGRWFVDLLPPDEALAVLQKAGRTPLPPYIRRPGRASGASEPGRASEPGGAGGQAADQADQSDRDSYQTVFAARPGAVAAPTAGLHFTERVLSDLKRHGIDLAGVTLHVGLGTFAPVKRQRLADHRMHCEWFELPPAAAEKINTARKQARRIVAVGTTAMRVLESSARSNPGGDLVAGQGWTDLFIYPPARFHAADALITNFHLPASTLLMLVAAFCSPGKMDGTGMILNAYAEAIRMRYRFYSYGDAMLIL